MVYPVHRAESLADHYGSLILSPEWKGETMRKNKKYGVIFADGSFRKVNMTPELANKLSMYATRPLLIIGK